MKKVRRLTFKICVSILALLFGMSAINVKPMSVQAATVNPVSSVVTQKITLAAGTKDSTDLYIIDSGKPGPVVMVAAGMHGDGTAGVKAAQQIAQCSITKGKLLVLPEGNKRAVQLNQRLVPGGLDLNRIFPRNKNDKPGSLLARDIYEAVQKYQVKWLIDLHEDVDFHTNTKDKFTGQTLIYQPQTSLLPVVEKIVNGLNKGISKSSERFTLLRYPVYGSLVRSAADLLGVNAFIFETTQKQSLSTRVGYHLAATDMLLSELGMKAAAPGETRQKVTVAAGTKYATDLYIIDSGKPGPVVMIVGGMHGSETAGYQAANKVTEYSIKKGKLLVLPEANKRAVAIKKRLVSGEGDLNRAFPDSSSQSPKNTLSKAIYQVVKDYKVEWLMDMHEGFDYYKNPATDSVGQTVIHYPSKQMTPVAQTIVNELNKDISKSSEKYSLLKYPIKTSLARSTGQFLGVNSFIFETSMKQTLSTRVKQQLKAANTLLGELGMR